jgi:regulator of RNase E activity RraA
MNMVERLHALPTAAISDALDRIGIEGALEGIAPLDNGFRAVGPAFTVRYAPVGDDGGTVGDFLDDVPAGTVIVIDNDGRTDVTVWGWDHDRGRRGARDRRHRDQRHLRDVSASLTRVPLFGRGRFMRTGKDRVRLVAVGEALTTAGITIRPGDLVCADADGAVVVPAEEAERVAQDAERIEPVETEIVAAVRGGSTLRAARRDPRLPRSAAQAGMSAHSAATLYHAADTPHVLDPVAMWARIAQFHTRNNLT